MKHLEGELDEYYPGIRYEATLASVAVIVPNVFKPPSEHARQLRYLLDLLLKQHQHLGSTNIHFGYTEQRSTNYGILTAHLEDCGLGRTPTLRDVVDQFLNLTEAERKYSSGDLVYLAVLTETDPCSLRRIPPLPPTSSNGKAKHRPSGEE